MIPDNKKRYIATLHRAQILKAAERLFSEKGYEATTIADISEHSNYSRKTIYTYFENKEDILNYIIEKGLLHLNEDIETILNTDLEFNIKLRNICYAFNKFYIEYPYPISISSDSESETINSINNLQGIIYKTLADFIEFGKASGYIRPDIEPQLSVYILKDSLISFIKLANCQNDSLSSQFTLSYDALLEYGFNQILNSILK